MSKTVLAFDFGASSGRAMLGNISKDGVTLKEIHRFPNCPKMINGTFTWDFDELWKEVKTGIKKGVEAGGFDSIGIDTWGVDFGCIDKQGNLIESPVHYRDLRTEGMPEEVFKIIPQNDIYDICGIQFLRINTLYQLWYLKEHRKDLYDKTDKILMIPDLFAYLLTGVKRFELTDASTTNLLNARTQQVDDKLLNLLGIKKSIFAERINSGEKYGLIKKELADELGCKRVPVIAVCTHDTASAVASMPSNDKDNVYISSGTWSLMGIENDKPILTPTARELNLTNEIGYNGSIRFLKNIMGTWLLQQTRNAYIARGVKIGFPDMEKMAVEAGETDSYIDVDNALFEGPGDMIPRVKEFCKRTGQAVPETDGQCLRIIHESLVLKYFNTLKSLETVSGKKYHRLYVVGGGTQAKLLIQMTADACGIEVSAGPVEATATGNVVVQMIAHGEIKDLHEARDLIAKGKDIWYAEPHDHDKWVKKYEDYVKILAK